MRSSCIRPMSDVQSLLQENAGLRERVRELEQQLLSRSETPSGTSQQTDPLLFTTATESASHANGNADGGAAAQPSQKTASATTTESHRPLGWTSPPHGLTHAQIARYSRHLLLPSFGVTGMQHRTSSIPARHM